MEQGGGGGAQRDGRLPSLPLRVYSPHQFEMSAQPLEFQRASRQMLPAPLGSALDQINHLPTLAASVCNGQSIQTKESEKQLKKKTQRE